MHMADALISPVVGGTLWAATAAMVVYCSRHVRQHLDGSLVPLMGVLGAFVFAAQMINFTIPGTGSSGHLGGALLLAALLGPHAGFLTMASILTIQALFFADGGLLALGCNIFNLGFFPCFVAYPLIYKAYITTQPSRTRLSLVCVLAAVLGLQLGAICVALETAASGIAALPFTGFLWVLLPIHLLIGIVEGLVIAAVLHFIQQTRPELLHMQSVVSAWSIKRIACVFALLALCTGGGLALYASDKPDGLEWSIAKFLHGEELAPPNTPTHAQLAKIQEFTAIMPDYATSSTNTATSLAGIAGSVLTLILVGGIGLILRRRTRHNAHHASH